MPALTQTLTDMQPLADALGAALWAALPCYILYLLITTKRAR